MKKCARFASAMVTRRVIPASSSSSSFYGHGGTEVMGERRKRGTRHFADDDDDDDDVRCTIETLSMRDENESCGRVFISYIYVYLRIIILRKTWKTMANLKNRSNWFRK